MAQQTAVEWLLSELQIRLLKIKSEPNGIVRETMINNFLIDTEQAKAMEKEQMCNHFREGYMWCNSPSLKLINGEIVTNTWKYGELYYNEIYNK